MGDGAYLIELLVFGAVAAFLIHRLWSVLGRRHGEEEQRQSPFQPDDRLATVPGRAGAPTPSPVPVGMQIDSGEIGIAAALAQLRLADPSFAADSFLKGAQAAFKLIVETYAAGDKDTLRPLVSADLFRAFAADIDRRQAAGETLTATIHHIRDASIIEARLNGIAAHLTVRFLSEQTRILRDRDGNVIDTGPGDADADTDPQAAEQAIELVDVWTFVRNIRSDDPAWELIETRVEG